ncbi:MAG: hypothetical protein FWD46_03530 [Cystobacterineae bacterium]|nr:hypothetical protein [Cystobacterineae bacterium]
MRERWAHVVLGACAVLACCAAGIFALKGLWFKAASQEEASSELSGKVFGFRFLPEDENRFWGRDDKVFLSMVSTEAEGRFFGLEAQIGAQAVLASTVPCVAELPGKVVFQQCFEIDLAQFREIYGQHDIRSAGTKLTLTPIEGLARFPSSDMHLHISRKKWVLEPFPLNAEVELAQTSTGLFVFATGPGEGCGGLACRVLAIDTQGRLIWATEALGVAKVSPVIAKHNGREVVVVAIGGQIYVWDVQTGRRPEGVGACEASQFGTGASFGRMVVLNASVRGPLSILTRLPLSTGSSGSSRELKYVVVRFELGKGCTSMGVVTGHIDETHPMVAALSEQGEMQLYMLDEVGQKTWLRAMHLRPEGLEERGAYAMEKKSPPMEIAATRSTLWLRAGVQLLGFRLNLSPMSIAGYRAYTSLLLTREGGLWLGTSGGGGEGPLAGGVLELGADGRRRGEVEGVLWRGRGGLLTGDGHMLLAADGFILGIDDAHIALRYQWPVVETEHALGLWPLSATRGLLVAPSLNRLEAYVVDIPALDSAALWPRVGHDLCNSANLLTQASNCWDGLSVAPAKPPEATAKESVVKEAPAKESATKETAEKESAAKETAEKESASKEAAEKESVAKEAALREGAEKESAEKEAATKEAVLEEKREAASSTEGGVPAGGGAVQEAESAPEVEPELMPAVEEETP